MYGTGKRPRRECGKDLGCTLNLVTHVPLMTINMNENDYKKEGDTEILVGTFHVSEIFNKFVDFSDLYDETGCLEKEAYFHKIINGRLIITGSDKCGPFTGFIYVKP